MTRKKSSKRALLMSILSLLTCMTMLIGSTFAWFTDSVTSSGNIIKSGTLKVGMEWADGKTDPANANTSWKDASTGAIFSNDKWEPGYVDAKHIRISNKGTLALKYQLNILANGTVSKLADVIDVYFADGGKTLTGRDMTGLTRVGTLTEVLAGMPANMSGDLDAGKNDTVTIALKMQETANNDYQGLEIGSDFAVQLFATQLTAEEDSFDDHYDKFADYDGEISGAASLSVALSTGGTYKVLQDFAIEDTMIVPAGVEVNLDLGGNDLTGNLEVASGATLVVANGSINNENSSVSGIQNNGGELVLDDVNIESARHGVRVEGGDVTINGGLYEVKADPNGEKKTQHALNVSDGANVIVNDGTFVGPKGTGADSGSAVNVQAGSTVTIYGGNFSGGLNSTLSASGTLVVYGGTFDQNPAVYVAPGYVVTDNGNGTWTVGARKVASSSDLSSAISSGETVELSQDITYSAPINNNATINLKNNTFEATSTINLGNNADLAMSNGNYVVNSTYGHIDVRPSSTDGSAVVFEDVNFAFKKLGPSYGPSTDRLGSVLECCPITEGAKAEIIFRNCTFDNAQILFEGMSGKTGEFKATFENCTFNALTSSAPIYVQNYIKGELNVIGCTFNLTCTSSSASAISVSSSTSTAVIVNATNNTINAVAATPYTYDASKGEDQTYNVKVNGTPANIKFISISGTTSSVNESGTVKTGIAQ
ncbi:MAG: hypothetical protein J6A56_03375 [Clostridia bacterium]|nr:hypothetical protein [Clostridia bacterium]